MSHIPHRNLAARTDFVVLSTANGTALTLSGGHIVYMRDDATGSRVPAPARDVKVCELRSKENDYFSPSG